MTSIEKTLKELFSLTSMGMKLGLENITQILELMGNPHRSYKIIHIAGTNGKGSTASILEESLLENGNKVGKYTSPHIEKFNERIVVNKEQIDDEFICKSYQTIRSLISQNNLHPTFFEITTAIMFQYFKEKECEYVVLETGLGGRFDATNICDPIVSIITNISLDHTNILGDTLEKIAYEKCGIIKKSHVIIADEKKELIKMVESITSNYTNVISKYREIKFELTDDFHTRITLNGLIFDLSLYGEYQVNNFLGAYEALKIIGLSDEIIIKAVKKVVWPGRFEIYSKENPIIILDGAHNVDAASKLKINLLTKYKKDEIISIVSILEDKDRIGILNEISGFCEDIIFTSLEEFHRGTTSKCLLNLTSKFNSQVGIDSVEKAFERAINSKKVIVICGSFYLLSKFKKVMKKEKI